MHCNSKVANSKENKSNRGSKVPRFSWNRAEKEVSLQEGADRSICMCSTTPFSLFSIVADSERTVDFVRV